ncbi:MAG: HEAT repeat domain-containing protein [Ktedonobacteraceae bacterium]
MNAAEIIYLLEKPTKNRWSFVYQIRNEAAVSDIVAALQTSTNPFTRHLICYLLNLRSRVEYFKGTLSEMKPAVPALIEALVDPDDRVCGEAIDALGHIGDSVAGPALLALYHAEEDPSQRLWLVSVMAACQYSPAIPLLIEALSSVDAFSRSRATRSLKYLQAQEAKEPLRKALAQEIDPQTGQVMQETLQELEYPSTCEERIVRWIAHLKNAETSTEREVAAIVLGDTVDERVLAPLLALLHDKQNEVRQYATLALSSLSESNDTQWFVCAHREQVQGSLIQILHDPDSNVRATAAQALGQWGDERAVEPLLGVIQDEDDEVRKQVVEALGYLKDERTLEPLLTLFLTDKNMTVRSFAAQGLGHWEDPRAVHTLIQALQNEQASVRSDAAEMLIWLKDERATEALLIALQDKDSDVREWSIEALWALCTGKGDDFSSEASEKMRQPVFQALQDESSEVRESADKILQWFAM